MAKIIRYRQRRRPTARRAPRLPRRIPFWALLCVVVPVFAIFGALTPGPDSPPQSLSKETRSSSSRQAQNDLVGRASITDGDTITIGGQEVRFNGIDAPESDQRCKNAKGSLYACGRLAAQALDEFLAASRPTTCQFVEWDQYGRFVGNCFRADGASIAAWLVRNGQAMDWPRYSDGAYANDQSAARAKRVGIWQGEVQPPWEFRAEKRTASSTTTTNAAPLPLMSGSCNIKGNVSNKGERIYHVPGQRHYEKTRIDRSKGERMFCSEAEARQAGWRRSKV